MNQGDFDTWNPERLQVANTAQSTVSRPVSPIAGFPRFLDKYFYFVMSLLMAAVVVNGFGRTVDHVMFHPAVRPPAILWVHAAVFSGFVLFFIFQSALVRTRNVRWHRLFGWFGAGLGAFMIPLGIATAIVMERFEVHRMDKPGAYAFLISPLVDMVCFTALFVPAIAWRKKPELHRRLIFVATCVLLSAAFGRFPYLGTHRGLPLASVDVLILLGVVRDLVVNRRVHGVYLIGLPVLVVCQRFVVHTVSAAPPWWLRIAHAMIG
jgi:hypothetical protein